MSFLDALPLLRAALTHGDQKSHRIQTSADEGTKYEVVEFDKVVFNHECIEDVFHDPQGSSFDDSNERSSDACQDSMEPQSPDLKIKILSPKEEPAEVTLHVEIFTEGKAVSHQPSTNCRTEGKSSGSQSLITETAAIESNPKSTICPVCLKRFANTFSRRRHELIHSSARPVQCQVCSRTFRNEDEFSIHSRIHMVRRSFSCKLCPKAFRRSEDLWKHYSLSHAIERGTSEVHEKTYLDNKPKKFNSRKSMRVDQQPFPHASHNSDESYPMSFVSLRSTCPVCLKTFSNSFSRRRHEVIHSKMYISRHAFRCQLCAQSFRRPMSLRRHYWQVHRNEKLEKWRGGVSKERHYFCAFCDLRFHSLSSKLRHERFQHPPQQLLDKQKVVEGVHPQTTRGVPH